jgi:hypothetical protein
MALPKTVAKFNDYAKNIRAHMAEGEKARVRGYELLVELKARPAVWQAQYQTWASLLREERLCPAYSFRLYEKARTIFTQAQLVAIGIQTCNSVAAIKDTWLRAKAKRQVVRWSTEHKRYTYQDLHRKLRASLREKVSQKITPARAEVIALHQQPHRSKKS